MILSKHESNEWFSGGNQDGSYKQLTMLDLLNKQNVSCAHAAHPASRTPLEN